MSPEERLSRLERVVKMMAGSGQRTRSNFGFRIDGVIDAQIRSEYLFNDRFVKLSIAQDRTDGQIRELRAAQKKTDATVKELVGTVKDLTVSQKTTDEQLRALIEIVGRGQNGKP